MNLSGSSLNQFDSNQKTTRYASTTSGEANNEQTDYIFVLEYKSCIRRSPSQSFEYINAVLLGTHLDGGAGTAAWRPVAASARAATRASRVERGRRPAGAPPPASWAPGCRRRTAACTPAAAAASAAAPATSAAVAAAASSLAARARCPPLRRLKATLMV